MKLSATKFAKEAGVTTPTVTRAIENGEISAEKKHKGGYLIDAAELNRFMANRKPKGNDTHKNIQIDTPKNNNSLQVEIDGLRERLSDKDATIEDLRTRLDREGEERRQVTAVLTDMRKPQVGFWARLIGGK